MSDLVRARFDWIESLRKGLTFLLEDTIDPYFELKEGADPLCAFLTITLNQRLPKDSRMPLRDYIRSWASEGDCEIPNIDINDKVVFCVVLFKHRNPKGHPLEPRSRIG